MSGTADYNAGDNWSSGSVPSGTATFGNTSQPDMSFNQNTTVGGWTFDTGASDYTFTNQGRLVFNGAGIEVDGGSITINNQAGFPGGLIFENNATAGDAEINSDGSVIFTNSADAGDATINVDDGTLIFTGNSDAGTATIVNDATTRFQGDSRAVDADITNNDELWFEFNSRAGSATIENNGTMVFDTDSRASNAEITNNGTLDFIHRSEARQAEITNNSGGTVTFQDNSDGMTARFINNSGGIVDISGLNTAGTTAGSIEGAGDFVLGDKDFEVGSLDTSTEVSGVISGAGGSLTKTGTGTLTLTGTNTYTGQTTITEGMLLVNGSIASSSEVVVQDGAILGGTGTAGATTVNSGGVLRPGAPGAIGTLDVSGDITFQAGSIFEVHVDPTGASSDLVRATGQAFLDGGTVVHVGLDGDYQPFTSYTILTAESGRNGEFDAATSDFAFLNPVLDYDANNVYLQLVRNDIDFSGVGRTFNQRNTGQGVQSLGPGNALWNAVAVLGEEQARAAFDALSGEVHPSIAGMLVDDSRFVREAVSDRMASAFASPGVRVVPLMAHGPGGAAPAGDTVDIAAWASGYGAWSTRDSDGNAAKLDHSTGGILIGIDGAITPNFRLGLLAGYGRSSFDVDRRAASGSSDNYHLGLYGGGRLDAVRLSGGLAYTWHDVETSRSAVFPGFADSLSGDYAAGTFQAFGEAGYRIGTAVVSLEPFAGLAHVSLHTDGFTEDGGAAALSIDSRTTDTTFTTLGVKASTDFDIGSRTATAHGTLGWRHAFGDTTPLSTHAFAGGDTFSVAGVPVAEDAAVIDAGVDLGVADNATLGVAYSGQVASDARDHGFKAYFSMQF